MRKKCDYCQTPFIPKRKNQRFCNEPGKHCRQKWHQEDNLPGVVSGIRALKHGGWSITIHMGQQPHIQIGHRVRLETDDKKRLDA